MTQADALAPPAASDARQAHIVDVLIEERAPKLSSSWIWPLARPLLYTILNYDKAVRMADAIAPMRGREALDYISQLLQLKLEVTGLERVPASGPFLMLANHPTGITDGLAVYDAVKSARPDVLFYANSDAHRACPGFVDNLIPVERAPGKRPRERTRAPLKMTEQAFGEGRPIVIFPAGRLARVIDGVLTDREWQATAASLARKYSVPIVPCHVAGPYSFWFHTFAKFSAELRDITLFHEFLNKQGKTYQLKIAPLIPPEHASGDATSTIRRIKRYIERVVPATPDAPFDPAGPECTWRDPPLTGAITR